jgi:hypothetical protein
MTDVSFVAYARPAKAPAAIAQDARGCSTARPRATRNPSVKKTRSDS